uniref:Uncharacterized protein n=1 Tax=Chromera velia CCMP2878 TaxID=1169474 RepID=A0A0G4HFD3_9ALVE|eukprot:Cvel_1001.t1-p1 / transcript=Cvel_1001.t1 / gene=Cvel_1001 / organism=Chromera_velia_CCMP2878 / gene_product=hypothetical protein / transcript_product=hypothetical protein / location=Cvel_scaffold32:134487-137460(-) / protein_length=223 / sequence_SO=supercontig / SO=protein_coding / is_pseudo=false
MSKPAELPVNSIDVQSQEVGGGYGRKEVKEQKVKESVAVKGDGGKRWELRPKPGPTKKQKMKQEKEKARVEKLEAESLRRKREMMPTHSSRQVFTLLPQEGDSKAVLLYKEKKREYWKEKERGLQDGEDLMGLALPMLGQHHTGPPDQDAILAWHGDQRASQGGFGTNRRGGPGGDAEDQGNWYNLPFVPSRGPTPPKMDIQRGNRGTNGPFVRLATASGSKE